MASNISVEQLGEVKVSLSEFEWAIPNFTSLSKGCYYSPSFSFARTTWHLAVYPNGLPGKFEGNVLIYIFTIQKVPPIALKVSFAIKTLDGKKDQERNTDYFNSSKSEGYISSHCILKDELLKRASELLPANVLTVLCLVKHLQAVEDASGAATSLCSYCKSSLDAGGISSHEKKCTERPIKCPECSEVVLLQDWHAHECETVRTEEEKALIRDFKKMLSDGRNHDLILKVKDKELRAHRDILSSRSHVFESMLYHDMKEKNSGIIDVPDCDPEAMKLFLLYIYTGKVEILEQSHMLGLYYIADKYDMQGLKNECRNFIKKSLSHTNICDVIQLAVNHSDSDLLDFATEYFIENALEIAVTVEWQSFLKENSTLGNELFIKSFRKLKNVKVDF